MTFEGAIIREQNVTFGIAIVKQHVLDNPTEAAETVRSFAHVLGVVPTVLMAQDSHGVPTYYGRRDIVDFLASIDFRRIPWKVYTVS